MKQTLHNGRKAAILGFENFDSEDLPRYPIAGAVNGKPPSLPDPTNDVPPGGDGRPDQDLDPSPALKDLPTVLFSPCVFVSHLISQAPGTL